MLHSFQNERHQGVSMITVRTKSVKVYVNDLFKHKYSKSQVHMILKSY